VRTAELVRKHFPNLKIFARARNRQHAFRLLDLGVEYQVRETFGSSLELSTEVLQALGLSKLRAIETVQRFRIHDDATLLRQQAIRDDEKKLIQSGREAAEQLLHLFETDADQPDDQARTGT
jgi:voltage-gated potassium channel Kch